jgi:hypothetical protein
MEEDEKGILFLQNSYRNKLSISRYKPSEVKEEEGEGKPIPKVRWAYLCRFSIKLEIALLGGTLHVPRGQYYYTFIEYIYCHTNSEERIFRSMSCSFTIPRLNLSTSRVHVRVSWCMCVCESEFEWSVCVCVCTRANARTCGASTQARLKKIQKNCKIA